MINENGFKLVLLNKYVNKEGVSLFELYEIKEQIFF